MEPDSKGGAANLCWPPLSTCSITCICFSLYLACLACRFLSPNSSKTNIVCQSLRSLSRGPPRRLGGRFGGCRWLAIFLYANRSPCGMQPSNFEHCKCKTLDQSICEVDCNGLWRRASERAVERGNVCVNVAKQAKTRDMKERAELSEVALLNWQLAVG